MEQTNSYCEAVKNLPSSDVNIAYHDQQYGFPLEDDNELFGRLILEINQAGLSWTTILKKADNFRKAFDAFSIQRIAEYNQEKINSLLEDASIIRNKLKIAAVIHNAQVILTLQKSHGSFKSWLDAHHPQDLDQWVRLFRKTFKFTGGEITNEFLMSTGYLPGAHVSSCGVYHEIISLNPPWYREGDHE